MQPRLWSQSIARKALLGEETHNPSLAARFLLGPGRVVRAERFLKRTFGRKRRQPGNPLPGIGLLAGGLPGIGRRTDPKKDAQRAAAINNVAAKAMTGDEAAAERLQRIASGLEWPGQWAAMREIAANHLQLVTEKLEKLTAARAEQLAARREAGAAAAARESRFLEAGTSIGSALASSFGRSRRPAKRRRTRRRY